MAIRAAVIGVGYLGQHHARIYSGLDGVELVAVADPDLKRANEIAGKFGARAYGDYKDFLEGVDAVSIVTPTSMHHKVALVCMRAGLDVLVEKPISTTIEEADELIEVAKKMGRILQVGHLESNNPAVVKLSSLLGEIEFIESERVSPFKGRGTDVDVTLDLMIHDIDIITSLVGDREIVDIKVAGAKVLTDKLDVAKAWIEFDGGISALITASRISKDVSRLLKIYQRDSFVMLDYQKKQITKYLKTGEGISSLSIDVEDKEPLMEELKDFIDCVETRRAPLVSGADGRRALDVAMQISRKIRGLQSTL